MAGTLESPDTAIYGDLEVTAEAVAEAAGPSNNDLESAGFIGSVMLALFTLVRAMDMLSQNRYALHRIIGPRLYSVTPGLIGYAVVGLFLLLVSPKFTRVFVHRGAAGMGRLMLSLVGWLLVILSIVPLTVVVGGLPPVGYTSNFFGDVFEPLQSAYGPAAAGVVLILIARFAATMRVI